MILVLEGSMGCGKAVAAMHFAMLEKARGKNVIFSGIPKFRGSEEIGDLDVDRHVGNKVALIFHEAYYFLGSRISPLKIRAFFRLLREQHRNGNWNVYFTTQDASYLDKTIRMLDDLIIGRCVYDTEKRKEYIEFNRKPEICGIDLGRGVLYIEEIYTPDVYENPDIDWGKNVLPGGKEIVLVSRCGDSFVVDKDSAYKFGDGDKFELLVDKISPVACAKVK